MKNWIVSFWVLTQCVFLFNASAASSSSSIERLSDSESLITLLATNDIHGGILPRNLRNDQIGGLSFFSGVVRSIREGIQKKYGSKAGVLLLDAGDQFQGTLISNYTEGDLIFSAMNRAGYDAAVPGNHDFDFGPIGWLEDRVTPRTSDQNQRGVIEKLASQAHFPLLSANTYIKNTITDFQGNLLSARGVRCQLSQSSEIDWSRAKRPSFLKPYVIKTIANVRVALVGLDNPETPQITTPENVADLCFRDEAATYREIRNELEDKADLFVLIIHNGDSKNSNEMSRLIETLASKPNQVHAVISGHTHFVINKLVKGIPMIQSGSGGDRFGRIDLIWNHKTHSVDGRRIQNYAGIDLFHHSCDEKANSFCSLKNGVPSYEEIPVIADAKIRAEVEQAQNQTATLASRKLGTAEVSVFRNRTSESALADILTDAFREMSGAEIVFLNTGGLRANIAKGPITYEDLFQVLPFNNHAVEIGPMPWKKILSLLETSVRTCGSYGALMQSGLRVKFSRDCRRASDGVDKLARVEQVQTLQQQTLYDRSTGVQTDPEKKFRVATLDFLAAGGSSYTDFVDVPLIKDLGIFRETLANQLETHPTRWNNEVDHRWIESLTFD